MDAFEQKLSDRFATFDHDGDGVLTEKDFQLVAWDIIIAFDLALGSPKAVALVAGAQQYWSGLAEIADKDADGRISLTEFLWAADQRLRGNLDGFAAVIRRWAEAVVAIADTDDDGKVTIADWARMLRTMGVPSERASARAAAFDVDYDGQVTVEEVMQSAVDFYTSNVRMSDFAAVR